MTTTQKQTPLEHGLAHAKKLVQYGDGGLGYSLNEQSIMALADEIARLNHALLQAERAAR